LLYQLPDQKLFYYCSVSSSAPIGCSNIKLVARQVWLIPIGESQGLSPTSINQIQSAIMRTHNKHPQWQNQPLRLNTEERKNPLLAIQDFFDSYHLEEVRQILWSWMVEVVTSQRSIANSPRDRNNNIFFYEKIEALVEAAYLLRNKSRAKKASARKKPKS
jgi:hypothetical protein